jgi:hypothetical protein
LPLGGDVRLQIYQKDINNDTGYTNLFVSKSDAIPGQVAGKDLDLFLQKRFQSFFGMINFM